MTQNIKNQIGIAVVLVMVAVCSIGAISFQTHVTELVYAVVTK